VRSTTRRGGAWKCYSSSLSRLYLYCVVVWIRYMQYTVYLLCVLVILCGRNRLFVSLRVSENGRTDTARFRAVNPIPEVESGKIRQLGFILYVRRSEPGFYCNPTTMTLCVLQYVSSSTLFFRFPQQRPPSLVTMKLAIVCLLFVAS
jgi:hypothetical protein